MAWSTTESYRRTTPRSAHESRTVWPASLPAHIGRICGWTRCVRASSGRCEHVACRTGRWCHAAGRICVGKRLACVELKNEEILICCETSMGSLRKNAYQSSWKTFWWHYQSDSLRLLNWPLRDRLPDTHPLAVKRSNFYWKKKTTVAALVFCFQSISMFNSGSDHAYWFNRHCSISSLFGSRYVKCSGALCLAS